MIGIERAATIRAAIIADSPVVSLLTATSVADARLKLKVATGRAQRGGASQLRLGQ